MASAVLCKCFFHFSINKKNPLKYKCPQNVSVLSKRLLSMRMLGASWSWYMLCPPHVNFGFRFTYLNISYTLVSPLRGSANENVFQTKLHFGVSGGRAVAAVAMRCHRLSCCFVFLFFQIEISSVFTFDANQFKISSLMNFGFNRIFPFFLRPVLLSFRTEFDALLDARLASFNEKETINGCWASYT